MANLSLDETTQYWETNWTEKFSPKLEKIIKEQEKFKINLEEILKKYNLWFYSDWKLRWPLENWYIVKTKIPNIVKILKDNSKFEISYVNKNNNLVKIFEWHGNIEDFDENNVIIYRNKKHSEAFKLIEHNWWLQLKKCLEWWVIVREWDYYLSKDYSGRIIEKTHKDNC